MQKLSETKKESRNIQGFNPYYTKWYFKYAGLLHNLSMYVTPTPHVRLHLVQFFHGDQSPSIASGIFVWLTHLPYIHHYEKIDNDKLSFTVVTEKN